MVVVVVGKAVEEEVEETRAFPVLGMTQMILPHPTQAAPCGIGGLSGQVSGRNLHRSQGRQSGDLWRADGAL